MAEADETAWETFLWHGGPLDDEYVARYAHLANNAEKQEKSVERRMGASLITWGLYLHRSPLSRVRRVLQACELLGARSPAERYWY
jgi:hypothetical protein